MTGARRSPANKIRKNLKKHLHFHFHCVIVNILHYAMQVHFAEGSTSAIFLKKRKNPPLSFDRGGFAVFYSTAFRDSAILIFLIRRFIKMLTAAANTTVHTNASKKLSGASFVGKNIASITIICMTMR